MDSLKVGDIIEVKVTGLEPYGIFVRYNYEYTGLIHISEIDNSFIKNINDYVHVGELIYANIIGIDEEQKHLNLSIKNMNYDNNASLDKKVNESISGFLPLSKKLDTWIEETLDKIKKEDN